jgi:hypothetical protein
MSEAVIIALISTFGTVLVAILGLLGKLAFDMFQVKKDAAVTKEQTTNSHTTNLRDDLTHVKETVTAILAKQDELVISDKAQWKAIEKLNPTTTIHINAEPGT